MEQIKRREKRKDADENHRRQEPVESCVRETKGRCCTSSQERIKNQRNSSHEDKENFVVPLTPRTPRTRRPPTYGMASSPPTSASRSHHRTKTPMSAVLSTSIDKQNMHSENQFLYLSM